MKIRFLLPCLLAALMAMPVLRAAEQKETEKQTELEAKMEKMNGAWRKLRARDQLTDATKNADSLVLVATIRKAAEEAIQLTPKLAAQKPEADRAKFTAGYQAKMKSFLVELAKMEAALKAGRNDEAAKLVNDLNAFQRDAHREFRPPEPRRPGQPARPPAPPANQN